MSRNDLKVEIESILIHGLRIFDISYTQFTIFYF
jgi:hypothetical protein